MSPCMELQGPTFHTQQPNFIPEEVHVMMVVQDLYKTTIMNRGSNRSVMKVHTQTLMDPELCVTSYSKEEQLKIIVHTNQDYKAIHRLHSYIIDSWDKAKVRH